MWIEERTTKEGTVYCYCERYTCPVTHRIKKVAVTLNSTTTRAQQTAYNKLLSKIESAKEAALKKDTKEKTVPV